MADHSRLSPSPAVQRPVREKTAAKSTRKAAQASRTTYTEAQILDAAEALFARHGLRGTRVREISQAAGVNEATLYNYYKNKEALYEAVLERGIRPVLEIVRQTSTGENSPENIRQAASSIIHHLAAHPHVSQLVYLEAIANGSQLEALVTHWLQPFALAITDQLKQRAAQLTSNDYPQIVELFWHLSFGHFALAPVLERTFQIDTFSDERINRQIQFIENLLATLFAKNL